MLLADFLGGINTKVGVLAAIATAVTTVAAAVVKLRAWLTRSRLIAPNAFPLPEVPGQQAIFDPQYPNLQTMLVGRDRDIRDLTRAVQNRRLNFLYGESGSGKSTLIKLGLARELNQTGAWIPIYLDIWGQDWIRGPRKSLADSTDFALRATNLIGNPPVPVTEDNLFLRLAALRATTGRRPVLLFDQLDDYQNQHRALFRNPETGLFLTPDELCAANPFWRDLRDLLLTAGDPIHVLFATRDDAESGLHCFRFEQPGVYPPLARLASEDASLLIHRLAPETVVRNPENGFRALVELLVAELSARGGSVLPMQLRVALAGVGRLTGPLTPSRIERLGGVPGLGARYLESTIHDMPGAWDVLNAMAQRTPDGRGKAVPLTRSQMEALLPPGANAAVYLEKLLAERVLRRRLADSEDETWQLYHDYLADAVVALDRRKRRYSLLLEEARKRYQLAGGFRKWTALLSPATQLRLFWRRLRDPGFRFGEYGGFVRVSLFRLVLNLWTLSAVLIGASAILWSERTEAEDIAQAFLQGGNPQQEFQALWRLASTRSDYVRRTVFERLLSTRVAEERLAENGAAALAALGLRISSLDSIRGLPFETCAADEDNAVFANLMAFPLASDDVPTAADRILKRMKGTNDANERDFLGRALAELVKGISGHQAVQTVDRILERMKGTTNADELLYLGLSLAELAKGISGNQATPGADRILDRMKGTANADELSGLGSALAELAKGISGNQATQGADRIVERMKSTTNARELSNLGLVLAELAKGISGNQATQLADRILEQMKATTDDDELSRLVPALAELAKGISGDRATQGADRILERMKGTTNALELSRLGSALAELAKTISGNQVTQGADRILERMKCTTSALELSGLGSALAELAKAISGNQATQLADRILERMKGTTSANDLSDLGLALAKLSKGISGNQATQGADRILERMKAKTNTFELSRLGWALAELAEGTSGNHAAQGADRILERMKGTNDVNERNFSGGALAELAKGVSGNQATQLADRILERMKDTTNADELSGLGSALAKLAKGISGDQATQGAEGMLQGMKGTTDKDELSDLGSALAELVGSFPQLIPTLADGVTSLSTTFPCGVAVTQATRDQLPLLIDMLKWPTCGPTRDGVMLRIAELENKNPTDKIGAFDDPSNRSTYRANLREFIIWLKTQKDANGRSFDVDGPPIHNPYSHPQRSGRAPGSTSATRSQ